MTAPPPGKTEFVAKIFEWLNALDDGQKFLTILITFLTMLGTAFGVGVSFGIWLSHKKDISGTITDPPFTGDTANGTPLHVTVLNGIITGVGLTYTVNVNVE